MKVRSLVVGAGAATAGILYIILGIAGLLLHLWTILISLGEKGIIAALVTLVAPVLAELYWSVLSWRMTGTFLNTYTLAIVGYLILFMIVIALFGLCSWQADKIKE